jgi:hypothetical protein
MDDMDQVDEARLAAQVRTVHRVHYVRSVHPVALAIVDPSPRPRTLSCRLLTRDLDYFSMGLFARVG